MLAIGGLILLKIIVASDITGYYIGLYWIIDYIYDLLTEKTITDTMLAYRRKNMAKTLIISLITLITFIAASCAPPVTDIGGNSDKKTITGTLTYENIEVSLGSGEVSVNPVRNIEPFAATVEYTIVPVALPSGLTFISATGRIIGEPDAVFSSASYVVTATGTGDYEGTVTSGSFAITITEAENKTIDGSMITYPDISVTVGTDLSIRPTISTIPADATVEYTIAQASPLPTSLPSGLAFEINDGFSTGNIVGTPDAISALGSYVVTATGTGDYAGVVMSDSFTIVINSISIGGSELTYPTISETIGTDLSIRPTSSTIPADATVEYTIAPSLPSGLDFEINDGFSTGNIVGTPDAISASKSYMVTATGTGNYEGVVMSGSFTIVINKISIGGSALTYPNISGTIGTDLSIRPTISTIPADATVVYTIAQASPLPTSLPSGLEFEINDGFSTGNIVGTPDAISASASYVVTATGTGNYEGVVMSDSFTIVINRISIDGSMLMYQDIYGTTDIYLSVGPASTSTIPANAAVAYTIMPATLPSGLTFSSVTGEISGEPNAVFTTSPNYVVTATAISTTTTGDAVSSNSFTINITINKNIDGSTFVYSDISGTIGTELSENPISSIPLGATIEYTIAPVDLPSGLIFEGTTGEIHGTPDAEFDSADYVVTAMGTGEYSGSVVSQSFAIAINRISIDGSTLAYQNISGTIGTELLVNPISSIPANAAVAYTIVPEVLPSGLTLDEDTGEIRGTPDAAFDSEDYVVTATATNDATTTGDAVSSDSFTIVINRISIGGFEIAYQDISGTVKRGLSVSPASSTIPEDADVLYGTATALPSGLEIDSLTGEIRGTPDAAFASAQNTIYVNGAGNYEGVVSSNPITITIERISIGESVLTYQDISGTIGTELSVSPASSTIPADADVEYTIASVALPTSLPSGLMFNEDTGEITGTPNAEFDSADYVVTATAKNDATTVGTVVADSFTITINKISIAESAITYPDTSGTIDTELLISPTMSTIPMGATVVYTIDTDLPSGLDFEKDVDDFFTGKIVGTPVAASAARYTVTATGTGDYEGTVTSNGFIISIVDDEKTIRGSIISYQDIFVTVNRSLLVSPTSSTIPAEADAGVEYTISPTLPGSLTFDSRTGEIGGFSSTPSTTIHMVTATATGDYTGTTTSDRFVISIKIPIDGAGYTISYESPIDGVIGSYLSVSPESGIPPGYAEYTIDRTLPGGLNFIKGTGEIFGTPNEGSTSTSYTVTATATGNYTGTVVSNSFTITIQVPISSYMISYPDVSGTVGTPLSVPLTSTVPQGVFLQYTISPNLPDGLDFEKDVDGFFTGNIVGTPVSTFGIVFTVTAAATGGLYTGSVSDDFTLTVQ